jgi:hypothetical protein
MKIKTLLCVASLSCSTVWAVEVNVIANSDFENVDANNAAADWKSAGKIEVAEEGVNGSKVLRSFATIKGSTNIYRGSVYQKLPDLTPGKYILSGEFKGDLSGLYLVVFYTSDTVSGGKFTKWISVNPSVKTNEDGWYKFSETLEVPAGGKNGMIVIETHQKQEKDQYTDLDNVKLIKQEDKK